MGPYLLGLRLSGRRVLVVGGGRVAQRRVPALLEAGAEVTVVSPSVTPALDDLIAAGRVTWHARPYEVGDCDGAWLVQACTDDRSVNTAVAAEAEAKRVWCVRADDKDASAAWTPATGRVDEISVAVTAGGDPRRAAGIRDAVVEALRDGTVDARRNRTKPVGVALVGGGPGDPGLITVRGRQLLAQADVVVADRLAPRALLDELAPTSSSSTPPRSPTAARSPRRRSTSCSSTAPGRASSSSGSKAATRSCSAAAARR
ncbi:Siroheme synthase / Precorrin-2 oxidase / Sirohydrochlorin ferrochelatase / Uroporphyrinogen-III methyltransferase [[Actinomadura] parvosata subsp. kistnae]|nr:Siroheme synthase / Precorrin-2 oxidase / Sirohydrochlorin ferrochelatase / Uroporphyrinogen-III methyltransferase [Actinomadura parvosata subsp. kistnae]